MKPEPDNNTRPTVFGLTKKREEVITILGDAFVANDLDIKEYERRLEISQKAASIEALENAIYDFPQYRTVFPKQQAKNITGFPNRSIVQTPTQPSYAEPPAKHMIGALEGANFVTFIGNINIGALDIIEPSLKTITVIGDSVIDLVGVADRFNQVRLECYGVIGNLKVKVPQNTAVSNRMIVILGEKKKRVKGHSMMDRLMRMGKKNPEKEMVMTPDPSVLQLELVGFSLIGDVTIEYVPVDKVHHYTN